MDAYKSPLMQYPFLICLWLILAEVLRPVTAAEDGMNPIARYQKYQKEHNAIAKLKQRFELLDKFSSNTPSLSRNCYFSPIQCNLHPIKANVQDEDFYDKHRYTSLFRSRRSSLRAWRAYLRPEKEGPN